MQEWFLSGLSWFCSTTAGGLVTYFYTWHRDGQKEKEKARNKLTSTCYSVCFTLAMQLSELGGLLKDIEHRIETLKEINKVNTATRDQMVTVMQDFLFDRELRVNIKKISEVLLLAGSDKRGTVEALQSIFLSNKKYFKIVMTIERFNEVKRIINQDTNADHCKENLLNFADNNLIQYHKEIKQNIAFISQSFEAFKAMLKEKFNVIVNFSMGEVVKIN